MKVSAFREILIKKTSDGSLRSIIKNMDEEFLIYEILESLRKDARTTTNSALMSFIDDIFDKQQGKLKDSGIKTLHSIRDAAGHHAARFGAAVDAMHDQGIIKENDDAPGTWKITDHSHPLKKAADRHAKQWVKLNNLVSKANKGIHKITEDPNALGHHLPVSIGAWQLSSEQYSQKHKSRTGSQFDLPQLQYWHNKEPINQDYTTYLINPPSPRNGGPGHEKRFINQIATTGYKNHLGVKDKNGDDAYAYHNGAFPMEHVKILDKYPTINDQDTSNPHAYIPHSFDNHPILSFFHQKEHPSLDSDYKDALAEYERHPQSDDSRLEQLLHPDHGEKVQHDSVHGGKFNQPPGEYEELGREFRSSIPMSQTSGSSPSAKAAQEQSGRTPKEHSQRLKEVINELGLNPKQAENLKNISSEGESKEALLDLGNLILKNEKSTATNKQAKPRTTEKPLSAMDTVDHVMKTLKLPLKERAYIESLAKKGMKPEDIISTYKDLFSDD